MKKMYVVTAAVIAVAALAWFVDLTTDKAAWAEVVLFVIAITATLIGLGLVGVCVSSAVSGRRSPYLIFGLIDGVAGVIVAGYAVYDLCRDIGFFPGLLGWILLIYVVPIAVLLLIGDIVLWAVKRKKRGMEKQQKCAEHTDSEE